MGDLAFAELPDLIGRGGLAFMQFDPGANLLAIPFVRHADDLGLIDLGMLVQELLMRVMWIMI